MQTLFKLPAKFLQASAVQLDQMPVDEEFEDGVNEDIDAGRWVQREEEKLLDEKENS